MNLQVIASPQGEILWVSGPLPGAVHDLTAARIWGIIRQLAAARLIVLADKGYIGAGDHVLTPYRGRNKPASRKPPTPPTPSSAPPASAPTPSSRPGASCVNSAAAPRAQARSLKPSTSSRPARSPDEKRSMAGASADPLGAIIQLATHLARVRIADRIQGRTIEYEDHSSYRQQPTTAYIADLLRQRPKALAHEQASPPTCREKSIRKDSGKSTSINVTYPPDRVRRGEIVDSYPASRAS
jgi:hypothetical protein